MYKRCVRLGQIVFCVILLLMAYQFLSDVLCRRK
jgi:hypothetical protein